MVKLSIRKRKPQNCGLKGDVRRCLLGKANHELQRKEIEKKANKSNSFGIFKGDT